MKLLKIIVLLLLPYLAISQPGGGGGLQISAFFDSNYDSIDIRNNKNFQLRSFYIVDDIVTNESFVLEEFQQKNALYNPSLYLPPFNEMQDYLNNESTQRLFIIYKKDTMIIDFIGIIGENGAGHIDFMDSVVVKNTYSKYYRNSKPGEEYNYNEFRTIVEYLRNGFTDHSIKILDEYIIEQEMPSLDFLKDKNLPSSFFFTRANYKLTNNNLETVLQDINNGIKKDDGKLNCEAKYLLCDYYSAIENYDSAIFYIDKAIRCKKYNWDDTHIITNLHIRLELYIKAQKYELALEDYNRIINKSSYKLRVINQKASFQLEYLEDYDDVINTLGQIVNDINSTTGCYNNRSEFAETYFNLGLAYFYKNKLNDAADYWIKAEENRYLYGSSNSAILHFDSIINQYPNNPKFYFARALAIQIQSPYLGGGDLAKESYRKSINDLKTADSLGFSYYKVNYYIAFAYHQLDEYQKALDELDILIKKNKDFPFTYRLRYDIREDIGKAKWGDKNDVDLLKYEELCKLWINI